MHVTKMGSSDTLQIKLPTWVLNKLNKQRIEMEAHRSVTTASSQADEHSPAPVGWTKTGHLPVGTEQHSPTPRGQLTPKTMKGQRETRRKFWKRLPHGNQASGEGFPSDAVSEMGTLNFVTAVNSTIGMLGLLSLGNPDQTHPFLSFTSSPGAGQWVPVLETHTDTPLPQWCTELTGSPAVEQILLFTLILGPK